MEDKVKEEVEDVAGWAAAVQAKGGHASVHPAESVSHTGRGRPAIEFHAPVAGKR